MGNAVDGIPLLQDPVFLYVGGLTMKFNSNKAFWFEMTPAGYPVLVKPDGSRSHAMRKKAPSVFDVSRQSVDGWRRAMLYMDEYNVDDSTAFSLEMSLMFCFEYGWNDSLLFASCQKAEQLVYPYLNENQRQQCRDNVDAFYNDKNLQASWTPLILHPVCLKFTKDMDDFQPMAIADIGESFLCLQTLDLLPQADSINKLKDNNLLRDALYSDRDFN